MLLQQFSGYIPHISSVFRLILAVLMLLQQFLLLLLMQLALHQSPYNCCYSCARPNLSNPLNLSVIPVTKGTRQGAIASPTLFNNGVLDAQAKCLPFYIIKGINVSLVCYADSILNLSPTIQCTEQNFKNPQRWTCKNQTIFQLRENQSYSFQLANSLYFFPESWWFSYQTCRPYYIPGPYNWLIYQPHTPFADISSWV